MKTVVKFYTIDCPKCKVLETKLKEKNVDYETITDIDKISELGVLTMPYIVKDDMKMDFSEAINWLRTLDD